MKCKKMMAALLCAALLCSGGALSAFAADQTPAAGSGEANPDVAVQPEQTPEYMEAFAVVEETAFENDATDGSVLVKTEGENGQEIQLNVNADTVFLDTKAGIPVSGRESIKKGDRIYVYYDIAMTRSLPPQTYAHAVLVNLEEGHAPAHLLTAEEVRTNPADGSVVVLCSKGGMLVTIGKDTPISPLYTKNIVRNTDIEVGTRFFAWYDVVALSMPGQAAALKVVLLPEVDNGNSGEAVVSADGRFTDVKAGDWFYDSVNYCAENGLMSGTGTDTFGPNTVTSREMIATVLWHVAGSPKVEYNMTYKDVPAGSGYADAIRWASKEGIVSGYSAETFGMGAPITREELAVMLYHYAQKQGKGFAENWMFKLEAGDAAQVSEWADEAMHWCVMNKVISGNASGMLSPQGQATRAETAAVLQHFNEAVK